ncbi:cytochrome c-type biogenesis protein [Bombella saccharophila]|uniref:Cytochrome c-type biogenesis protein n=1 Tax=Bombella saccharophila TaxID=2967338 RepID=A0ABT3W3V2_9PROT|nr:cytochrome c-type biogenesis protein [Bombella saccharophila]MCX5613730.1 cytochrome c-type biogenesis protein CcmH [Bombella saccharophila]
MMRICLKGLLLLAICLYGSSIGHAIDSPDEMLPDPVLEQKAQHIGQQLRCLVCQNESIEESSAPLAKDLRHIVRQQLQQGRSPKDITLWMTQRYGEFIRLQPRFSASTALLWLMPLLSLMIGFLLARPLWARRTSPPPPPLTVEERQKLNQFFNKD